jgi:hypothetical protein
MAPQRKKERRERVRKRIKKVSPEPRIPFALLFYKEGLV